MKSFAPIDRGDPEARVESVAVGARGQVWVGLSSPRGASLVQLACGDAGPCRSLPLRISQPLSLIAEGTLIVIAGFAATASGRLAPAIVSSAAGNDLETSLGPPCSARETAGTLRAAFARRGTAYFLCGERIYETADEGRTFRETPLRALGPARDLWTGEGWVVALAGDRAFRHRVR
jgi:hypothetical protein